MSDSNPTDEITYAEDEVGIYIPVTFNLTEQNEGHKLHMVLPLEMLWGMARAANNSGMGAIMLIVDASIHIAHEAERQKIPSSTAAVITAWSQIIKIFGGDPESQLGAWIEETPKEEEVLRFTYGLLKRKVIPHQLAAQIASVMRQEQFTPNAWRKKVDRWARRNGLAPVQQRNRGRKE